MDNNPDIKFHATGKGRDVYAYKTLLSFDGKTFLGSKITTSWGTV